MAPFLEPSTAQPNPESQADPDALMPQATLTLTLRHRQRDEDSGSRSDAPSKQHCSPTAFAKPELGSINAILREHCRTRLFVEPIIWTCEHLRLLECRFDFRGVPDEPQEDADPALYQLDEDLFIGALLRRSQNGSGLRRCGVRLILAALGIHAALGVYGAESFFTYFLFGHRRVSRIRTDGIFSASGAETVAYLHLDTIRDLRHHHVKRPCKKHSHSSAASRSIRGIKLRRVQPPRELEDPYIVAVLIALAQGQRRRSSVPTMTVTLILERHARPNEIYVYQARISSEFLDKFDNPSKMSPCDGLQVQYWGLALDRPDIVLDLLQRLCKQPAST